MLNAYYSACRRRGGVLIKMPPFLFLFFFGVESWTAAHGRYRWHQVAWAHRNTAFKGGICQQNMHFNMYTTISKPQEGSAYKDSHAKCFITTNSTVKLSPGAMNRSDLWAMTLRTCFQRVFLASAAVFPLKIVHIDQTHILLNYLYKTHFLICKLWTKREQKIL